MRQSATSDQLTLLDIDLISASDDADKRGEASEAPLNYNKVKRIRIDI